MVGYQRHTDTFCKSCIRCNTKYFIDVHGGTNTGQRHACIAEIRTQISHLCITTENSLSGQALAREVAGSRAQQQLTLKMTLWSSVALRAERSIVSWLWVI